MIKNIINTFFFRSINAVLAFLVVVLTARYLGAEIRGEISLFVLNVTIIFQLVSVVSGGGLVFYAPRRALTSLIGISLLWAILASAVGVFVLFNLGFIDHDMLLFTLVACLLLSFFYMGMNIILGFEKIRVFNALSSLQMISLIAILYYLLRFRSNLHFEAWLYAYLFSFAFGILLVKWVLLKRWWKDKKLSFQIRDLVDLIQYGKWAQLANITQLLNYRLGYYLLEYFAGKAALGVYSAAVAIAEGVWLISKSFSMVVFTRIANMKSRSEALQLALQYARISLYFSVLFLLFLLVIPASLYIRIFGEEFGEIKPLLLLLSPGVVFFALSSVYAHYFSGTARPRISSYSSMIGLLVTVLAGFILIPAYEMNGVAITASLSFCVSAFYLAFMILKEPDASLQKLLPQSSDGKKMMEFIRRGR
jgi:O-antigen/teichoic acid export membrane protein